MIADLDYQSFAPSGSSLPAANVSSLLRSMRDLDLKLRHLVHFPLPAVLPRPHTPCRLLIYLSILVEILSHFASKLGDPPFFLPVLHNAQLFRDLLPAKVGRFPGGQKEQRNRVNHYLTFHNLPPFPLQPPNT